MMFLTTFVFLLSLMALMSVGVVVSGKRLRGSCGGTGTECACDAAGKPRACETPDGSGDLSEAPLAALPGRRDVGHSRRLRSGAEPSGPTPIQR